MLKLAVVGKDVTKSESPSIHKFILKAFGTECSYEKVSLPPEEFLSRAESLFQEFDAFNVTIPFKADIIPYLKDLRGDAPAFKAVNVVLSKARAGYNTDGYGFLLMLENAGIKVKNKKVLLLGAGGAGRSCIKKLIDEGADVFVCERDENRLKQVYEEFGGFTPLGTLPLAPFDIILNCTGIGMHDTVGKSPVGADLISMCDTAVDLIYVPEESEFLRLAREAGKHTLNGASMLFYQAYMGDCILLGRTPSNTEAKKLWNAYQEKKI